MNSGIAEAHVDGFVSYRRAQGHMYVEETVNGIIRMARFLDANREKGEPVISKRLAEKWVAEGSEDGTHPITRNRRAARVRLFARYLARMGREDCYVWPEKARSKEKSDFAPYILTHDEVARVTQQFDSMGFGARCRWGGTGTKVFPAMFRTIYGCGLRRDEARLLRRCDIDLSAGTVFIRNSKDDKSRRIPISDSLAAYLRKYEKWLITFVDDANGPFFPSPKREFYSRSAMRYTFRNCFESAGVRNQAGRAPRIHDLRHTFAVHSLRKAVTDGGMKSYEFLPILATYLGHTHIRHAEYYLHLTLEGQDSGIAKMEQAYGNIYKEVNTDA